MEALKLINVHEYLQKAQKYSNLFTLFNSYIRYNLYLIMTSYLVRYMSRNGDYVLIVLKSVDEYFRNIVNISITHNCK